MRLATFDADKYTHSVKFSKLITSRMYKNHGTYFHDRLVNMCVQNIMVYSKLHNILQWLVVYDYISITNPYHIHLFYTEYIDAKL